MRKFLFAVPLLVTGCVMTSMNQEGIAIIRDQSSKAQEQVVAGLHATKALVDELQEAAEQDREPNLAPPLKAITESLSAASSSINEAGKTAVVLQEGMGQAKSVPPQTQIELDLWRRKYAVLAKMMDAAMSWLSKAAPGVPLPTKEKPEPWSTTETTGLVGTILAIVTGGGVGGKKLLDKRKQSKIEQAEAEAAAAEAEALTEKLRDKLDSSEFEDMMRENKRLKARLDRADYEKKANGHT